MKKFKYKLESLLKYKGFIEEQKKVELGFVVKRISDIKKKIQDLKDEIVFAKKHEEELLKDFVNAEMIQYYPNFYTACLNHIEQLQDELKKEQLNYEEKLKELNVARGDVKIFNKLKEKDLKKYKRKQVRKEIIDMEEVVSIRRVLAEINK